MSSAPESNFTWGGAEFLGGSIELRPDNSFTGARIPSTGNPHRYKFRQTERPDWPRANEKELKSIV